MILFTNFVPKGFDAITVWPFILVRPERRDDIGLIEHERVHYREQAWLTPLWWLWYLCSTQFRIEAEVDAYRVSMAHGMLIDTAACHLTKYDHSLSVERAILLLGGKP